MFGWWLICCAIQLLHIMQVTFKPLPHTGIVLSTSRHATSDVLSFLQLRNFRRGIASFLQHQIPQIFFHVLGVFPIFLTYFSLFFPSQSKFMSQSSQKEHSMELLSPSRRSFHERRQNESRRHVQRLMGLVTSPIKRKTLAVPLKSAVLRDEDVMLGRQSQTTDQSTQAYITFPHLFQPIANNIW